MAQNLHLKLYRNFFCSRDTAVVFVGEAFFLSETNLSIPIPSNTPAIMEITNVSSKALAALEALDIAAIKNTIPQSIKTKVTLRFGLFLRGVELHNFFFLAQIDRDCVLLYGR